MQINTLLNLAQSKIKMTRRQVGKRCTLRQLLMHNKLFKIYCHSSINNCPYYIHVSIPCIRYQSSKASIATTQFPDSAWKQMKRKLHKCFFFCQWNVQLDIMQVKATNIHSFDQIINSFNTYEKNNKKQRVQQVQNKEYSLNRVSS